MPTADARSVRPSERAALEAVIDRAMASARTDGPGVAVVLLRDGRVIAQRQYGLASLEHGVPFTPNHVVRHPYSEGREFVAITAALMEHDGLLRLDDSVRGYFPQLPAWSAPVRVRDLLQHRSGFVDEWSALLLMHGSMANRFAQSQFLRLLADQPTPEVEPRRGYLYSNSDYGLLRLVLEKAAHGDLAGYMTRRLFAPLGMTSTRLADEEATIIPHEAPKYAPRGDGYQHETQRKSSPDGRYAIATTACDLGRWASAHLDSTSEVARSVTRLMEGAAPVPALNGHYAFGRTVAQVNGVRVERHEGVRAATYLAHVPSRGLAIVTFGNRYLDPTENGAIVRHLLGGAGSTARQRFPAAPVVVAPESLVQHVGRYVSTSIRSWESDTLARELATFELAAGALVTRSTWGRATLINRTTTVRRPRPTSVYPLGRRPGSGSSGWWGGIAAVTSTTPGHCRSIPAGRWWFARRPSPSCDSSLSGRASSSCGMRSTPAYRRTIGSGSTRVLPERLGTSPSGALGS